MKVYLYDEKTKEYLYELEARIDPLESKKQGKDVWLQPANSTFTAPLSGKEGYLVVYDNGWQYKEILEEIPLQPTETSLKEEKRIERNYLLQSTDKYMLSDYPITEEQREQYKQYRQYLRDVPSSDNFPDIEIKNFENWKGA